MQDIPADEVIEVCPIILIPSHDAANRPDSLLASYFFRMGDSVALVLGYGSLYNHSYSANATYVKRLGEQAVTFRSVRAIAAGEEVVVNYNGGRASDQTPVHQHGIPPPETALGRFLAALPEGE